MSFDAFVTGYSVAVSVAIFAALALLLYYLLFNKSLMARISAPAQQAQLTEFVILKCPQCGFEKKRQFELGDYVGKVDQERCPHDNSQLVVSSIAKETSSQ
ncbi:hypothetical protein GCM10007981_13920 [Thermocladium modestius]|uniref:Uncharacterized protein n=1 Tax=Thermocladium modestius TaxID=62609 RepID=A0A830GUI6_9CREN|nr:hypothetical protein [Thermocladium modestius]GGP21570.1 hypothetical protein GCM10007981_13920 [Thermocladium modestius]